MGKAKRARKGQTITMIAGEHEGETGTALEDGETKRVIRVMLKSGPAQGAVVKIITGNYIVGG